MASGLNLKTTFSEFAWKDYMKCNLSSFKTDSHKPEHKDSKIVQASDISMMLIYSEVR